MQSAASENKRRPERLADWQLPPGVDRGLWDYLNDAALARNYDASLGQSPLFAVDEAFVEQHCPAGGRLLDLGCGTGRLLLRLARHGHPVLGVDLSREMLSVAHAKAHEQQLSLELLQANMTALECLADASFDCVACLFSSLGMVRGAEHRQRVADHAARLLRPGGRFVLHVHNRWFNVWNREGRRWLVRDAWRSLTGDPRAGDREMPVHQGIAGLSLHLFTLREARRLLARSGLQTVETAALRLRRDGSIVSGKGWPAPWIYGYLLAAERVLSTTRK